MSQYAGQDNCRSIDIIIKERTYIANTILTYKSVEKNSELSKENNEIFEIINDTYFKQEDIIKGKLNSAWIKTPSF